MGKSKSLKWTARIFAALAALILLTLAAWAVIAGPVTVSRVLRYGDTDIGDYRHYPSRRLSASPSPFVFASETGSQGAPADVTLNGMEPSPLDDLLAANDTIAFLVIKDDAILYERYFQEHTAASISQAFSVSKSFLAALVGAALQDGIIRSVDQPVTDYVPELAQNGFDRVTLRHLLTMTSGSDYIENDNPFGIHVILNYTPDLTAELFEVEVEDEPGTVFRYKSGDNALLALALDRALGAETVSDYTQRALWEPLGMEQDGMWSLDREGGMEKTWCCLAAAARDFAKLGRLYLRSGEWDGRQIFSPEWAAESVQTGAIPEDRWSAEFAEAGFWNYGYQWWLVTREDGDYLALGKDGQFLYVNPAVKAIVVRLGWSSGELFTSQWVELFRELSEREW